MKLTVKFCLQNPNTEIESNFSSSVAESLVKIEDTYKT